MTGNSTPSKKRILLVAGVLFMASILLSHAQTTAAIFGTVTDSSKGVLPGAVITATNTLTNESRTTETNEIGYYSLPSLALGVYNVRAEMPGFKTTVRSGIELSLNRNARVDMELPVGEVSEVVSVSGDAPLVESTTNEMAALIDTRRVEQLPLNGRNTLSLVSLVPGAQALQVINEQGYQNNKVVMNGARPEESAWLLDGGANNTPLRNYGQDVPNPDAIQEFRVISNNYSAEYGRSVGAVVNVVTRTGSNELHGSAFEFVRNRSLNAKNFFEPDKTPLKQHQFGGTLGGPIIKDKTFFFTSFQGFRRDTTAFNNAAVVPTAEERGGDFSRSVDKKGKPLVIKDPLTGQPFGGTIIPSSRLSPVAVRILDLMIPVPNDPARGPNALSARAEAPITNNQVLGKLDHQLSTNHKLSGAYFWANNSQIGRFPGNIDYQWSDSNTTQHNVNVHEYWTVNPTLLNHFRFTFLRSVGRQIQNPGDVTLQDLGSNFAPLAVESLKIPPSINVTGYFNSGTPSGGDRRYNNFNLANATDWLSGRHNLKFGVEGSVVRFHDLTTSGRLGGNFVFDGTFTGNGLADLLLGDAKSMEYGPPTDKYQDSWTLDGYVQDNFRVMPRLTLNLGLRYDLEPLGVHKTDRLIAYVPGKQSTCVPQAPVGIMFPCDEGVPRAGARNDYNNFGPRLGFAYDAFGDGRTVVRGGYGISYQVTINNVTQEQQVSIPFFIRETMRNTNASGPSSINLSDPWKQIGGSPYPINFDPSNLKFPATGAYSFQKFDMRTGYFHQYNLSVQRQIGTSWIAELAYVGNLGRKLSTQRDVNAPVLGPGATSANIDARRPLNPPFLTMRATEDLAESSYNSFQTRVEKRFSASLSLLGSYTYGKSIDFASWHDSQSRWLDPRNIALNKGLSDFDRRHIAVLSWLWQVPHPESRVAQAVLGGWSINGIASFYSGRPVGGGTVSNGINTGKDNDYDGVTDNDRPNLVGNPVLATKPSPEQAKAGAPWFNTAAFEANAPGTRGNAGRNIITAPGSKNIDLGLFRTFRISENHKLEMRGEFFNVFNWVNLGIPVFTMSNSNFGKILTAGNPRIVQLGVRYSF
jgi:hypothetical protein